MLSASYQRFPLLLEVLVSAPATCYRGHLPVGLLGAAPVSRTRGRPPAGATEFYTELTGDQTGLHPGNICNVLPAQ